jgi:hypothetical protein
MERCSDFKQNVFKECPPNICKINSNKCISLSKYSLEEEKELIKTEIKKREIHNKLRELILNFINDLPLNDKNNYLCFNNILNGIKDTKNNNIIELKKIYGEKHITDTQLRLAYKGLEYDNKIPKCPKNSLDIKIKSESVLSNDTTTSSVESDNKSNITQSINNTKEEEKKNVSISEIDSKPRDNMNKDINNMEISQPIIKAEEDIRLKAEEIVESENDTSNSLETENSKKLNSISRKKAIKMFIKEKLAKELEIVNDRVSTLCKKCNTIIQKEWTENKCEESCIDLKNSSDINTHIFQERNQLLYILQNITMMRLNNMFKKSLEKEEFLKKLFYEKLIKYDSFIDSMIDTNLKLENFINKVESIWLNYNVRLRELKSSYKNDLNHNIIIKYNYDNNLFEFYFKPAKEKFTDINSLNNYISDISKEKLYCTREKLIDCIIRENKCEWNGEKDEIYKCLPK